MRATYRTGYRAAMRYNALWLGLFAISACRSKDAVEPGDVVTRWSCEEGECACDDGASCDDAEHCLATCEEEED